MSFAVGNDICENWIFSKQIGKRFDRYNFEKELNNKIHRISIHVFKGGDNQRIEVLVSTIKMDYYFKIVECGLKNTNSKIYYFDSLYDRFPKNKNGFADVNEVKLLAGELSLGKHLFAKTFMDTPLTYSSRCSTLSQGFSKIEESLTFLSAVDDSVKDLLFEFTKEVKGSVRIKYSLKMLAQVKRAKDSVLNKLPVDMLIKIAASCISHGSFLSEDEAVAIAIDESKNVKFSGKVH